LQLIHAFKTLLGKEKVCEAASALGRLMRATEMLMGTSQQVAFLFRYSMLSTCGVE